MLYFLLQQKITIFVSRAQNRSFLNVWECHLKAPEIAAISHEIQLMFLWSFFFFISAVKPKRKCFEVERLLEFYITEQHVFNAWRFDIVKSLCLTKLQRENNFFCLQYLFRHRTVCKKRKDFICSGFQNTWKDM